MYNRKRFWGLYLMSQGIVVSLVDSASVFGFVLSERLQGVVGAALIAAGCVLLSPVEASNG